MLSAAEVVLIRQLRARGLSQAQVARETRHSKSTIQEIDAGRRTPRRRRGLAHGVPAIQDGRYRACLPHRCPGGCGARIILEHRRTGLCVACDVRRRLDRATRAMLLPPRHAREDL